MRTGHQGHMQTSTWLLLWNYGLQQHRDQSSCLGERCTPGGRLPALGSTEALTLSPGTFHGDTITESLDFLIHVLLSFQNWRQGVVTRYTVLQSIANLFCTLRPNTMGLHFHCIQAFVRDYRTSALIYSDLRMSAITIQTLTNSECS